MQKVTPDEIAAILQHSERRVTDRRKPTNDYAALELEVAKLRESIMYAANVLDVLANAHHSELAKETAGDIRRALWDSA